MISCSDSNDYLVNKVLFLNIHRVCALIPKYQRQKCLFFLILNRNKTELYVKNLPDTNYIDLVNLIFEFMNRWIFIT